MDHQNEARKSNMKVCAVYCGLFMESRYKFVLMPLLISSFGPWFGMNTRKGIWEPIGSKDTPAAFTALADIGKGIAALARLPPSEIPDHVRMVGSNISFKEASEAMTAVSGNPIEIKEIELE